MGRLGSIVSSRASHICTVSVFGFACRYYLSSLADNRLRLSGAESILADDDIAFARAVHFG